jgi:hypothetical protein
MADAPAMTAMDHIREAERLIALVSADTPDARDEIRLTLAKGHLECAAAINACRTTDASNRISRTITEMGRGMLPGQGQP